MGAELSYSKLARVPRRYRYGDRSPPEHGAKTGWQNTNQYTATLEHAYNAALVDRDRFLKYVSLEYVDMNAIPAALRDYDFCWSICALEHLGSIKLGLTFIEKSLDTLRPGGLTIHTTEYNYANDNATIDNWGTVLFQRQHFNELAEQLRTAGPSRGRLRLLCRRQDSRSIYRSATLLPRYDVISAGALGTRQQSHQGCGGWIRCNLLWPHYPKRYLAAARIRLVEDAPSWAGNASSINPGGLTSRRTFF